MSTVELSFEDRVKEEVDKIKASLEAENAQKLAARLAEYDAENNRLVEGAIKTWQQQQKQQQLTPEELNILLSQEYVTFNVKIITADGASRTFTLVELPQAIERKFIKVLKDTVKPRLSELSGLFKEIGKDGKIETRIQTILDMFDPMFEAMAATTAIVLNPFGREEGVDAAWCAENLSSIRMWNILSAQEHINKLRSFFLHVSPTSLDGRVTKASTQ